MGFVYESTGNIFYEKNGKPYGLVLRLSHIDKESLWGDVTLNNLCTSLSNIDEGIELQFISSSEVVKKGLFTSRDEILQSTGFVDNRLYLLISSKNKGLFSFLKGGKKVSLERVKNEVLASGLEVIPFEESDYFFLRELKNIHYLCPESYGLSRPTSKIGVIKVNVQGAYGDSALLTSIRRNLPYPYFISLKLKKVSKESAQIKIRKRFKQEENPKNSSDARKLDSLDSALMESELYGKAYFEVEMSVIFEGETEEDIQGRLKSAKNLLDQIGDASIEGYSAYPVYIASTPFESFHHPFIEKAENLDCFLPVLTSSTDRNEIKKDSLIYHRNDGGVEAFNVFSDHVSSYSGIISGRTGRGKSVLAQAMIQALTKSSKNNIKIIDVKGSHLNLCRTNNGSYYKFGGEESFSGFDVFSKIRRWDQFEKEVIFKFLEALLTENDELEVPMLDKISLEEAISKCPKTQSLTEFYNVSVDFIRKSRLKRWIEGSFFENIFSNTNSKPSSFEYFNFESLSSAEDKGLSSAVFSAILSNYLLSLRGKESVEKSYLIVDEAPFFIKSSFPILKSLVKNIRKLNGSLILVVQSLRDLEVGGDTTLIENCNFKFMFSKEDSEISKVLGLSSEEVSTLEALPFKKGEYSSFLFKNENETHRGFLKLTEKELMLYGTSEREKSYLELLSKKLPAVSDQSLLKISEILSKEALL